MLTWGLKTVSPVAEGQNSQGVRGVVLQRELFMSLNECTLIKTWFQATGDTMWQIQVARNVRNYIDVSGARQISTRWGDGI